MNVVCQLVLFFKLVESLFTSLPMTIVINLNQTSINNHVIKMMQDRLCGFVPVSVNM